MGKKIILTNQHCDNRGDESATIGLIEQIYANFGNDAKITMFKQTKDYQFIPDEYGIEERNMDRDFSFMFQSMMWILFKYIHLDIRGILSKRMKKFIKLHEEADIILSSCGGPYIGDIYFNHEILHIFYVLIPELLGKIVAFAAPSMGPFKKKIANPIRRSILKRAKLIVLRDKVSFEYVNEFLKQPEKVFLAADACFANEIEDKAKLEERENVIGFTPLEYKYPSASNREAEVEKYKVSLIELFDKLMEEDKSLKIEFFPQLYNKHSDIKLIEEFKSRMKYGDRTIVFSDKASGPLQQMEIGKMKMMIATRYHSAVFSCKMHVPVICIAYEHKAFAMMDSFDLSDCVIDINEMTSDVLNEKYQHIKSNYDSIYERQVKKLPLVTEKAKSTIKLAKEVYDGEFGNK